MLVSMLVVLRYFIFEPSLKLRWCRARDLFGSQVPVTIGGFELRISCIQSCYLFMAYGRLCMQEIHSSNTSVVTGICGPNKSRARHHRSLSFYFVLDCMTINAFHFQCNLSLICNVHRIFHGTSIEQFNGIPKNPAFI